MKDDSKSLERILKLETLLRESEKKNAELKRQFDEKLKNEQSKAVNKDKEPEDKPVDLDGIRSEIKELKDMISVIDAGMTAVTTAVDAIKAKQVEDKTRITNVSVIEKNVASSMNLVNNKLQTINTSVQKTENAVKPMSDNSGVSMELLESINRSISENTVKLDSLEGKLNERELIVADINSKVNALIEAKPVQQSGGNDMQPSVDGIKNGILELQKDIESIKTELASNDTASVNDKLDSIRQSITATSSENSNLKSSIEAVRNELSKQQTVSVTDKLSSLSQAMGVQARSTSDIQKRIMDISQSTESALQSQQQLANNIDILKQQLTEQSSSLRATDGKMQEHINANADIPMNISSISDKLQEQQVGVSTITTDIATLTQQLAEYKDENKTFTSDIAQIFQNISDISTGYIDISKKMSDLISSSGIDSNTLRSIISKVDSIDTAFTMNRSSIAQIDGKLISMDFLLNLSIEQIGAIQSDISNLNNVIDEIKSNTSELLEVEEFPQV